MKKIVLVTAFFLIAFTNITAQEISENAIGLRLGDNDGFGAEISYQKGLSDNNRLEFDLGIKTSENFNAYKLIGLYQWVWSIDRGFNWYAGAGGGLLSFDAKSNSGTAIFVSGDIGIEYHFDIPLMLSLDARPELYLNNSNDLSPFDIALSARYKF